MARAISISAHPRAGGDPCDLPVRRDRPVKTSGSAWVPACAGMSGLLGVLAPAAALAHPGDHETMTVSQVAHHIATSPDHLLEVVFLVLMVVGAGLRLHRRRAR
jgi:hypothetical protein